MKQLDELPRKGSESKRATWVRDIFENATPGQAYELVSGEDFPAALKVPASGIRRYATINKIKVAIRIMESGNLAFEVTAPEHASPSHRGHSAVAE